MDGGTPVQSFRDLTGMPVLRTKVAEMNDDQLFENIHVSDRRHWNMVGGCMKPVHGLQAGHAYSILGAYKLSNGVKLLKMRNPWGEENYNGPWRDDDPQWTDALRQEVGGHTSANDGEFFMTLDKFRDGFTTYATVMY